MRYAEALLTVNATQEDGAKGLQSMRHRRRHNQGFACAITTAPGARSSGREMGKRASEAFEERRATYLDAFDYSVYHLEQSLKNMMTIIHAKRGADLYVPILPALTDELRTHLQGRQTGFLFESNRPFDPHRAINRNQLRPCGGHTETRLSSAASSFHRDDPARFWARAHRPATEVFGPPGPFNHSDLCRNQPARPRR